MKKPIKGKNQPAAPAGHPPVLDAKAEPRKAPAAMPKPQMHNARKGHKESR